MKNKNQKRAKDAIWASNFLRKINDRAERVKDAIDRELKKKV